MPQSTIIRLELAYEEHFDSSWGMERSYYFIRGSDGHRYAQLDFTPRWAWDTVTLTPCDDAPGWALDDTVTL